MKDESYLNISIIKYIMDHEDARRLRGCLSRGLTCYVEATKETRQTTRSVDGITGGFSIQEGAEGKVMSVRFFDSEDKCAAFSLIVEWLPGFALGYASTNALGSYDEVYGWRRREVIKRLRLGRTVYPPNPNQLELKFS